jgi:hypothetical protein
MKMGEMIKKIKTSAKAFFSGEETKKKTSETQLDIPDDSRLVVVKDFVRRIEETPARNTKHI